MSGGWWTRDDGSRYWLDEDEATLPELPVILPAALIPPQEPLGAATVDGEPWTPTDTRSHPIVSFADAVCGLPLWPSQASLLSEFYNERIRTGVWRLGRRSGKGRLASIIATYESVVNADQHLSAVPRGEQVAVVVIATSQRQARILHRFIRGYFERDALAHLVLRDTDDELELTNGMTILTLPCTARSTRGYAVAVLIIDEAAWLVDIDGSPMSGEAIWSAMVPSTAQFAAGKVVACSTPRWGVGWFPDLYRLAASGQFADMRAWHATTRVMNPQIPDSFLDAEQAKDPAFAREYLAEFDSGVGAALDGMLVRAAVRRGMATLSPSRDHGYIVSIDPAYRGDVAACVVAHREGSGDATRLVVDLALGWQGTKAQPLDHRTFLDNVAVIAKSYGNAGVILDQFAQEPVAQGLTERGIQAIRKPWTNESKAEALGAMREYLHTDRLSLPDHGPLIGQLSSLERTVLPSGRPRIAAPTGMHDDFAMAALAAVHQLHTGTTLAPGSRFSMIA